MCKAEIKRQDLKIYFNDPTPFISNHIELIENVNLEPTIRLLSLINQEIKLTEIIIEQAAS